MSLAKQAHLSTELGTVPVPFHGSTGMVVFIFDLLVPELVKKQNKCLFVQ